MIGAMARLEGLRISREKFVSHFVHDLRACLRAAGTLPEWIHEDLEGLEDVVPPDVYRYLSDIKVNAQRAENLIDATRELCTFDWLEEPSASIELSDAVREALVEFPRSDGFEIDLKMKKQMCKLPPLSFNSVLRALLENACKHHGSDVGIVRVTNIGTGGALHIQDDGEGIPECYQETIFDPFSALKPRDVVEGSGLGLTIARRRAELWGGTLSVVSDCDCKGATFRLTFAEGP
ncbi:sensor histidine kinase [Roseobacter sp. GAI101]|uniref:sensor histidine kinase n=1 Tax=Roseobacter sp. (strain GAI101) TaxID=391589 RepID=UPI0009FF13CD|nr:HAMP domain-containing sensor histidine kinase [Roseobacter sp. GAI101]